MELGRSKAVLASQSRRHIFNRYRRHLLYLVAPIYLSFSVIDYVYAPEHFWAWFSYRVLFFLSVITLFNVLKVGRWRRRYSEAVAILTVTLACSAINIMIAQSGGYKSLYITGLILVTTTGIEMFRLNRRDSTITHSLCYLPTVGILFYSAGWENWRAAMVQSGFLIGITLLCYIYRSSESLVAEAWVKSRLKTEEELEEHRKTEFLKKHFPRSIREKIEQGLESVDEKRISENAVVGFVDIASSTEIGNQVDILSDWNLKEAFVKAATLRATECGLVVLTHLGDGFLFLANYHNRRDWTYNLITFYENLAADFQKIWIEMDLTRLSVLPGLKFGVAMGPTVLGFMGQDQAYYTAMGPEVNLASRLCDKASRNEIVVSGRVWYHLQNVLQGWSSDSRVYTSLKGFHHDVPAIHIRPRSVHKSNNLCPECGEPMSIVKTENGFIDFACSHDHPLANRKTA